MIENDSHPAPFRLSRPEVQTTSVVFASPHSGDFYPDSLRRRSPLGLLRLRSSEDAFVDRLLKPACDLGAPLICATYPRAWVDLNRAEDELDPALIAGLDRSTNSPRVMAGLGVIPRVVAGSRAIYRGKIPVAEAEARLAHIWKPYHAALDALLDEARAQFGQVMLLDMHSMPSDALRAMGTNAPQIVLGDRYGRSCDPEVAGFFEICFVEEGLRVGRNSPFAGAYVAQRHGNPKAGVHVVQIEIDRTLYMDESRIEPSAEFEGFSALMARVMARICDYGARLGRLAAE